LIENGLFVLAIYTEEIYVADGATLLRIDPIGLLYVATVLAQRLDSANQTLLELKRQIQMREPRDVIGKTAEKMEMLLGASGAHLSLWPVRPLALLAQEYLLRRFEAPHFRSKITPRLSSEFRGGRCGSEISGSAVRRCRAVCWTGHAGQFRKAPQFQSDVDSLPFG
jgi:hypothetical protein